MMKHRIGKIKRIMVTTIAAVCALSSTAAICASAADDSVTIPSSETTNGYTLKLSAVTGSSLGSKWAVTNGGPTSLKSKNSVKYVKKDGNTAIYYGNNEFKTVESTSQTRTVSTSKLSNYSRVAKIEATGYSALLKSSIYPKYEVYINAYY